MDGSARKCSLKGAHTAVWLDQLTRASAMISSKKVMNWIEIRRFNAENPPMHAQESDTQALPLVPLTHRHKMFDV